MPVQSKKSGSDNDTATQADPVGTPELPALRNGSTEGYLKVGKAVTEEFWGKEQADEVVSPDTRVHSNLNPIVDQSTESCDDEPRASVEINADSQILQPGTISV